MKILNIVSAIDLTYGFGCTPAWWQLFKALYELGHELIVVPYYGKNVETLWWRGLQNPCSFESRLYVKLLSSLELLGTVFGSSSKSNKGAKKGFGERLARFFVQPKWRKLLVETLREERDVDAVVFFNVPLTHIRGLSKEIKKEFDIRIIFFDGDMPAVFPKYADSSRLLYSSYYIDADLSEYDVLIVNSEGVIQDLKDMGANEVYALHFGVDHEIYCPIKVENQSTDVFFYGHGTKFREDWIDKMITTPSRKLDGARFAVGGRGFEIDLGFAKDIGPVPFSMWRRQCCQSKVNLNITRHAHANIYASSTSRPFELAAMECCIVSNPINGLDKWFDINKEILVAKDENEAIELYEWLLSSDDDRQKFGRAARRRVLKEHTFQHRAKELVSLIKRAG